LEKKRPAEKSAGLFVATRSVGVEFEDNHRVEHGNGGFGSVERQTGVNRLIRAGHRDFFLWLRNARRGNVRSSGDLRSAYNTGIYEEQGAGQVR